MENMDISTLLNTNAFYAPHDDCPSLYEDVALEPTIRDDPVSISPSIIAEPWLSMATAPSMNPAPKRKRSSSSTQGGTPPKRPKPAPLYTENPDNAETQKKKDRIIHAQKCKEQRIKKDEMFAKALADCSALAKENVQLKEALSALIKEKGVKDALIQALIQKLFELQNEANKQVEFGVNANGQIALI